MFYRGVASYIAYYFLQFYSHCDNLLPFSSFSGFQDCVYFKGLL